MNIMDECMHNSLMINDMMRSIPSKAIKQFKHANIELHMTKNEPIDIVKTLVQCILHLSGKRSDTVIMKLIQLLQKVVGGNRYKRSHVEMVTKGPLYHSMKILEAFYTKNAQQ